MTPREALDTLGLPTSSTPMEAKAAYRARARELHSDFHQDKDERERELLEDALRQVNAAWDCLKHFYDLPAAQRAKILGVVPHERERPTASASASTPPRSTVEMPVRRKRRRRTPAWLMVAAALVPVAGAVWMLRQRYEATHHPEARVPLAHTVPSGPVGSTGDPSQWIGRQVAVATCSGKSACNEPDCSAGPLLRSLRGFHGFRDAYVVYGLLDRAKTGLMFNEVLTALRPDRYSLKPIVVVTAAPDVANKRLEGRRNPGNACRFSFTGPMTLTSYGGPLPPEVRSEGQEEEIVLQLDGLRQPPGDVDTLWAEFEEPESGRKYSFEYGFRRDTTEGPVVPNAPLYESDTGSMYKVRFRRVEYSRDGVVFAANHEFINVTRLTGEKESRQYLNTPLMANPRKAIRVLERVDMPGIRQCQAMVNDPATYVACALRLIQRLEASGRINAMTSQELRYRMRNMTLD